MVVLNDLDRFHLVADVADRVPSLGSRVAYIKQLIRDKLIDHKHYIREHGQDMPEVAEWRWGPSDSDNIREPSRNGGIRRGGKRRRPRAHGGGGGRKR
jgi:hypothetical protein